MTRTNFFRNFILLLFIAVLFENCNPPTVKQESSTLIINVDTNCILNVDGTSYGVFKNGDAKKVKVNKGEHLIIAKSIDSSVVLLKQTIEIKDSASKVIDLHIARIRTTVAGKDTLAAKVEKKENTGNLTSKKTGIEKYGTFTDSRDGKTYKTVKIGNQTWMAENLRYKASGGCLAYDNDESNAKKYGYLYNWETAKKVCPAGWHLPTDAEWTILTNYLGGNSVAGGKLKSTTGWKSPNKGVTNSSGFTALPGGIGGSDGTFGSMGYNGFWWSSTEYDISGADCWAIYHEYSDVNSYDDSKNNGFSVRCVKDN